MNKTCDVLIIGAGMAGGCLARQLKLAMPDLKITLLERKTEFDFWIGESTVEVWTDYAYRHCDLGPYLHKYQNLKTGLRFFFDSEKKDLGLAEMSENGRAGYVSDICSHQLDRATFDRDICELNREIGVDVKMGCKVLPFAGETSGIRIDKAGGHLVNTSEGVIQCRWLVDAAGRSSPLAQQLNLLEKETRHPVGSYWGRFTNFKDPDKLGDSEWRARVEHTLRYLSTNHFMYEGYWIWMIPVTDKVLSIGVCFHQDQNPLKMKDSEDLLGFLREHKVFREVLHEGTEALDFMGFKDCARHAKQFFSEDRWFLTGMSGFVLDALYSTTGRTAAITNRLIGEMIKADRAGDQKQFESQVKHFNIYSQNYYEMIRRSVSTYPEFGSFAAWTGWRQALQSSYFNVSVPESTEDFKMLRDKTYNHIDGCDCTYEKSIADQNRSVVSAARRLLTEFHQYLKSSNRYFDDNKGGFTDAIPRISLSRKTYKPRDLHAEYLENLVTYEANYRWFLKTMAEQEGVAWHEEAFLQFFVRDWNSDQTIAMGLKTLKAAKGQTDAGYPSVSWNYKSPIDEHGEEISPSRLFKDPVYSRGVEERFLRNSPAATSAAQRVAQSGATLGANDEATNPEVQVRSGERIAAAAKKTSRGKKAA